MSGSINEDCGMIGRRTEELRKSSLDLESEGYTGNVEFALEIQHGACLTIPDTLTSMNMTRVHLAYLDTGRVGRDEHF